MSKKPTAKELRSPGKAKPQGRFQPAERTRPKPGGTTKLGPFRILQNYIFGSTAAIITNVSLIVGLGSARAGKGPILGSLLTIALADNISDSLGIHIYKETEGLGQKLTLVSTVLNFSARLLVSASFIAIVLGFSSLGAIRAAILWGLFLLTFLSYLITKGSRQNALPEIATHVLVAAVVIALSRYVGSLIAHHF